MMIDINGTIHNVPSDLSQITLKQFSEYYEKFGRALDEELSAIFEDGADEMLLQLHIDKEALSWYSFWTGWDFFSSTDVELTDLLIQYRAVRELLKDSETESREYPMDVEWDGGMWRIQDFRVVPGSIMSFNEIITGKEVVRQIESIGQGRWDALVYLCCIYFRKVSEPYKDDLLTERMDLMGTLPLNHAMAVAFFLSSSISIFKSHLLSLDTEAQEKHQQS